MYSVVVLTAIPKPGQRWRTKPASCPKRSLAFWKSRPSTLELGEPLLRGFPRNNASW